MFIAIKTANRVYTISQTCSCQCSTLSIKRWHLMPFLCNNIEHLYSFKWLVILTSETPNRIYFCLLSHTDSKFISSLYHGFSFCPLTCVYVQDIDCVQDAFAIVTSDYVDIVLVLDYTETASFFFEICDILVYQPTALSIINIIMIVRMIVIVVIGCSPYLDISNPLLPLLSPNNPYIACYTKTPKFRSRCPHLAHLLPYSIINIKPCNITTRLIKPSNNIYILGLII